MEASSIVWGLDIGHSSIKAVRLERTPAGAQVLGYAIEPIPVGDDVDRDEAVINALTSLAQREEIGATPVVAALSGRQVLSRSINVPIINENKVHRMVELEARQQIPGNFEDVRWGYHMSPGLDGASNDVALFAARKEIVDDLIGKCQRAGLTLAGVSVSSLAIYNFIQYDQEFADDESVIVLDVGAENTDLVVYQGDTLWMRSLGVSGNDITRAFMKKFRVSFEEAETLKCQVGDSKQAERILKVIESSLADLISDVQRSLGFYKSQNSDARFENVCVSGNTFRLPGLIQYMADRLGYAVITLIELEHIEVKDGLDRDHFLEDLQSLGVAMGLGLQGLGLAKAKVNLLPSELQFQSLLRQKRWAAVTALAALPIAFAVNHTTLQTRMNDAALKERDMRHTIEQTEKSSQAARTTSSKIPLLAPQVKEYESYGENVGLINAIEQGVLSAIEQVAVDESLLRSGARGENLESGDTPVLQPVYIDSLKVPNISPYQLSPFEQSRFRREVVVTLRVPTMADGAKVLNSLNIALRDVRQTETLWRALNPGKNEVPFENMPRLFWRVEGQPTGNFDDIWTYFDPAHRNQEDEIVARDYQNKLSGKYMVFKCQVLLKEGG